MHMLEPFEESRLELCPSIFGQSSTILFKAVAADAVSVPTSTIGYEYARSKVLASRVKGSIEGLQV